MILTSQNRRSTARTTNTPALHRIWTDTLEHRRLLQHVGYDDEPQHVASDVDVFEMRLLAVWCCDGDILHGDVEAVLGCSYCTDRSEIVSKPRWLGAPVQPGFAEGKTYHHKGCLDTKLRP